MDGARIGTTLQNRYRVDRKLGEGGMGAVYEGEHILIGRRVASKFLHQGLVPWILGYFQNVCASHFD
ncbi:MAG: serine/threonine protein kinase [Polyangiales bacterium]